MTPILQCLVSGLLMGAIYALVSVGLTLIFGIVELVNFSHADYLMVAMYISYCLFTYAGMDPHLARPIVVVVLPSPAGVGVIAVTSTSLPFLSTESGIAVKSSFALYLP